MVILVIIAPRCLASESETISLNGSWKLIFDEQQIGELQQWHLDKNHPASSAVEVIVPASWETVRKDFEGVGWYRRTFTVPKQLKDKTIRLHFGAVNYVAEVYLNGQPVGVHEGGYDPFEFTVDDLLIFGGPNVLIIRVISPIVTKRDLVADGMGHWEAPHWRGALVAGIWQGVKLKVTERNYVKSCFIQPSLSGSVITDIEFINDTQMTREVGLVYHMIEHTTDKVVWEMKEQREIEPGKNTLTISGVIPNPSLWSPDNPNLYRLKIVVDGRETFEQRFGVREFTTRADGLYLNGAKFYMKAGFWEGLYPNGLAAPDSPEMVEKEIRLAKEAGFNTLRPWRKPPVPDILDLADEMGICMIGAPAVECMNEKPKVTPQMADRIFHEIEAMVFRDRNHPSIIAWELFNEIVREPLARIKYESVLRVRALDPTRLIIDESGGWANGAQAYVPGSKDGVPLNEIHSYLRAPVTQVIYDDYAHMAHEGYEENWQQSGRSKIVPGAVTIVSEVGFGGFPDLASNMLDFRARGNPLTPTYWSHERLYNTLAEIMVPSGLKDTFGNIQNLCLASQDVQAEGNKLQVEAIRTNPKVHGYCVHAYTAGEWVIGAGVLDIWRNPKRVYYTLKEVNQPFYLSARVTPANSYVGQSVNLCVNAINEKDSRRGQVELVLTVGGKELLRKTIKLKAMQGITPVIETEFTLPEGVYGTAQLSVHFIEENGFEAVNAYPFHVFALPEIKPSQTLVVIDPENRIKPFLDTKGVAYAEQLSGDDDILILTSTNDLKKDSSVVLFKKVFAHVDKGATIIFFDPPATHGYFNAYESRFIRSKTQNRFFTEKIFPVELVTRRATGRWHPVNHAVSDHAYFAGLPTKVFMGGVYQNICADKTIIGLEQKPIVSSVAWDYRRDHWGIIEAWWGLDMAVIPYGDGDIVVSTLQLVEHLGKDPVADLVFANMVGSR